MFTDADQQAVIDKAAKLNIHLSEYDASAFLGARELLVTEPNNVFAAEAVSKFNEWMATGTKPRSFAEFMLPDFETVEERAAREKRRDDFIEYYRKVSIFGIHEGDYTASKLLQSKLGLDSWQILAMTDEELKQLRDKSN